MKDAELISIIYLFLIPPYVVVIMLLFWKRRKTFPLAPRAPILSLVFQFHILMVGLMGPSIILSDYAVSCYWYHWMWNIWNVLGVTTPTALRFVTFHWFCKMTQELEEHQVEPSITISHKSDNKDNNSRNNNPNQINNNNNMSGGTAQNSEPSSKADTHQTQIALPTLRRENTQEFIFTGGMETKEHVLNISRSGHNDRQTSRNSTPSLSNRRPSVSLVSNPSTIHNNNNTTNPITGWYTTHRHWISPKMLTLLLLSGYLWVFPLGYIFNAIYPNINKATMLYDAECPLMSPFNMIIFGPVCASIVVLGFLTRELAEGIFLRREFMIGGILGILPAFINLAPFAQSRTFEILCWIFIVPFIESVFGTYPVYLSFCYSNHQKQVEAAKRRELENSRKETIDSVKLLDVIRNEKGFVSYEKFLAKEFAAENLFFWRDVVKLEEFIDTENEKRTILIEKIRRDEERGREKKNILSQEFLEPGEQGLDFDDEPPTPLSTSAVYSSSDGAIMFTSTTTTPLTGTSTGSGQFTSSSTTSSVESSPAFTYNSIVTRPLLLPSASSSSLVTTPNSSPIISFTSLTSFPPNFFPAKLSSSIELPNIIPAKNSPSSSSRQQQQLPNIIPSKNSPSSTSRQHQQFPNIIPSKNSPSSASRQHQPFPNIIPSKNSPSSISRQQHQQLPTLTPSSSHASSSSSAHEIIPSSSTELPPPLEKSSPTSTSYYSGFPAISSPSHELTSPGPSTSSNSSSSSFPSLSTIPSSPPPSSGIILSSSIELSTQNNQNTSSSSLSESPSDQKTFHSVIPTHTHTTTTTTTTTTHPSIPISALVSSTNNNNNNNAHNTNNDVSFTRSPSNYLPSSPSSSTSWNHNPTENPEVTELMGEKTVVISSTIIRKQKLGRKGLVKIKRTAKRIYATYLAPEAPYQVNVPGELRVQLLVNMVKLNKDHQWDNYLLTRPLFEDIKNEVLALMDNDSFQRYKISPEFREYYQSLIHSGPGYEHA